MPVKFFLVLEPSEMASIGQSGDTHLMNVSEQQTIANEKPFVRWQRSARAQVVEYQI